MTLKNLRLALQQNNGNINQEINIIIDYINQFLTEQAILHYEIEEEFDDTDNHIDTVKSDLEYTISLVNTRLTSYITNLSDNFSAHAQDTDIHITASERDKWNTSTQYIDDTVRDHVDNLVIHVTQEDKDLWNATLDNAKDFARELFNRLTSFEIIKCNVLPTEDIKEMTIYFLQVDPEQDDLYEEYMYIDGKWEKIGNTRIDLSDYVTKSMLQNEVDTLNNTINTLESNINNDIQNLRSDIDQNAQEIAILDSKAHTHDNKNVLDRFSDNPVGDLLYNNDQIFINFTEQDVRVLINYLWNIEEYNFLSYDNKYILTRDNRIFSSKERGSL